MSNIVKALGILGLGLIALDVKRNYGSRALPANFNELSPSEFAKTVNGEMMEILKSGKDAFPVNIALFITQLNTAVNLTAAEESAIENMYTYVIGKRSGWNTKWRIISKPIIKKYTVAYQAKLAQAQKRDQGQRALIAEYNKLYKGAGMPSSSTKASLESGFGVSLGTVTKPVGQYSGAPGTNLESGFGVSIGDVTKPVGQYSGAAGSNLESGFGVSLGTVTKPVGQYSGASGTNLESGFGVSIGDVTKPVGQYSGAPGSNLQSGFGVTLDIPTLAEFMANPEKYRR